MGHTGLTEARERGDRLRHLHEGEDPLVHARAAGGIDRQQRDTELGAALGRAGELLAEHGAHTGAEKIEMGHGQRERTTLDRGAPGDQRLALAALLLRREELLIVRATAVRKPERVFRL